MRARTYEVWYVQLLCYSAFRGSEKVFFAIYQQPIGVYVAFAQS